MGFEGLRDMRTPELVPTSLISRGTDIVLLCEIGAVNDGLDEIMLHIDRVGYREIGEVFLFFL